KAINCFDYFSLVKIFLTDHLIERKQGVYDSQAIKEAVELLEMEKSFQKGDKDIWKTIKRVKDKVKKTEKVSELDIYHKTSDFYQEMGAKDQSFNTISGVEANGSIIHFSSPSDDVVVKTGDMILLDSGGYFTGGFATDTTRTFLAGGSADPK